MRIRSLRRILLLSINGVILLFMLITGVSTFYSTHHELDELFDAQLAQYARLVRHLLLEKPSGVTDPNTIIEVPRIMEDDAQTTTAQERTLEGHKYESKIAVQVWRQDGKLLLRSANAGPLPMQPMEAGYHVIKYDDHEWIGFSLFAADLDVWIFTAQHEDFRDELSVHVALDHLIPLCIALIPILMLVWFAVYWGTNLIKVLSIKLSQTGPNNLKQLDLKLPRELEPFQHAINSLLAELKEYVIKEKRFIADASHELRTPLSILQLHTDNLSEAKSPADMLNANLAIQKSTKRLSHLVFQLMEIQKLEHLDQLRFLPTVLLNVLSDAMAQIESKYLDNVSWDIQVDSATKLLVEAALFQCVLRNLLDNAAKYAQKGSVVKVNAEEELTFCKITIRNFISTEPTPDLPRLGERFFRHAANQDIEGSGLGLSIVRKIIDLHQIELTYRVSNNEEFIVELKVPNNLS